MHASGRTRAAEPVIYQTPHDSLRLNRSTDLAVYVTFCKGGTFFRHQIRQVRDLQAAGYYVVGVHALPARSSALRTKRLADVDIFRPNAGYDFGSYRAGMQWLSSQLGRRLETARSVILMNDSCFGRLTAEVMGRVQQADGELVGMFESFERSYHLQSFFLRAGGKILRSGAFQNFILSYDGESKQEAIENGEIRLSAEMGARGFTLRSLMDYQALKSRWVDSLPNSLNSELRELAVMKSSGAARSAADVTQQYLRIFSLMSAGNSLNPSHFFALEAIQAGCTLIKRELLFHNPVAVPNFLSIWAAAMERDLLSASEVLQYMSTEGLDERTSIWLRDALKKLRHDPEALVHPVFALEGLS